MKNFYLSNLLLLVAAAVFTVPLSAETNMLVNPSFEKGNTDGWAHWCMTSAVTDIQKHSGVYSVELALPEEYKDGALLQEVTEGFSIDKSLNATAWLKTDSLDDTDAFLKLEFWNKDGALISSVEGEKITGTKDWTEVKVLAPSVPPDTTTVKLLLHLHSNADKHSNGKAYFDDITLKVP